MDGDAPASRTMYEVLGPIRVVDATGEVVLPGPLQRRLLSALLLHRNRVVSADRLVEMLWPGSDSAPAVGALHSHLYRLRQRVPSMVVEHHPPGYVLRVDESDLDAHLFERAVLDAAASRRDDIDAALAMLDGALRLWRGEPFVELVDVDDGRIEIQRLGELRLRAVEERFGLLLAAGRAAEIVADLESYVAREPLREQARRMLIDALSAVGRRADALRVFDDYRRALAEELGVAPSPALRARHDALLAEDDVDSAPPKAQSRSRVSRGIPRRVLSSLVGRSDLIDQLERRVGDARLITLIGPGGVGKTRLAVEIGRRLRDTFPDGAVFCDLTEAGPGQVATVVLAALDIESRSGQDEFARLADVLRTDRCLLLLDNCEHILDEAAALAEGLLMQTEHLVMIATTRERLGVEGEQLVVVPPLSSQSEPSAGISPAVELFRDRARAVLPEFELDAVARGEVEDLCLRLDGLPLAIELAAGRLQSLSLHEVREGLEASLSVLRGGRRTVGRHRSVEATLDWSYRLLDEPDRAALHAAALFAGAFDAADVAHVLDVGLVAARDRLARLVECSLAHRLDSHFVLLDVVRRFAVERAEAGAADAMVTANRRHADRMLIRATMLAKSLASAHDSLPVSELNRMLADFRKAVGTAIDNEDADTALGIVSALRDLAMNAMVPELMGWGVRAAEVGARQRHPLTPDGYATAAQGAWKRGDLVEMRRLTQLADEMSRQLGVGDRYDVLGTIGTEHLAHGRLLQAIDCYRRSLECEEAIGHPFRRAESGASMAICLSYAHDPQAIEVADRFVDEITPSAGAIAASWCWYAAGECRIDSEPARARDYLERAVELARRGGGSFVEGIAGASLASLDVRAGRHAEAIGHYRWLLPLWLRAGVRAPFWTAMRSVVDLLSQVGIDGPAARLLGAVSSPSSGHEVFGDDDDRLAAIRARLVQRLGSAEFERSFRDGSALDDIGAAAEATAAFELID